MKNLDTRISECKEKLELLYIKTRSGEDYMEEVLRLSKEMDSLLLEKVSENKNSIECRDGSSTAVSL